MKTRKWLESEKVAGIPPIMKKRGSSR